MFPSGLICSGHAQLSAEMPCIASGRRERVRYFVYPEKAACTLPPTLIGHTADVSAPQQRSEITEHADINRNVSSARFWPASFLRTSNKRNRASRRPTEVSPCMKQVQVAGRTRISLSVNLPPIHGAPSPANAVLAKSGIIPISALPRYGSPMTPSTASAYSRPSPRLSCASQRKRSASSGWRY